MEKFPPRWREESEQRDMKGPPGMWTRSVAVDMMLWAGDVGQHARS